MDFIWGLLKIVGIILIILFVIGAWQTINESNKKK